MKEWVNKQPESADEWSTYITEYVHEQDFGSPGFEAVNDFYNLQNFYWQTKEDRLVGTDLINGKANLSTKERRDLVLRKISLLEHTIDQKEGSVPGYASAYLEIRSSFNDMIFAATREAKINFPENKTKQSEYVQEIYGQTLTFVLSSIVEKQQPTS